jgi:hypothetical protein
MNSIWADFARMIYNVEVEVQGANGDGQPAETPWEPPPPPQAGGLGALAYSGGTAEDQPSAYGGARRAPGGGSGLRAAAPRGRARAARPQRPVLVRVGQEVQEVPRSLNTGTRRAAA